jgi:hypothetical protein
MAGDEALVETLELMVAEKEIRLHSIEDSRPKGS